jgi:hypothetical protein
MFLSCLQSVIHPIPDFLSKILCLLDMGAASIDVLCISYEEVLCRVRAAVVRLLGNIVHQVFPNSDIFILCK